ncbi:MAG: hypothetical protein WCI93_04060 [bacterium]
MILRKFGSVIFLLFLLFPVHSIFAQTSNVGIIPANIWYSKDPFEEGDKIKIYTVVYNSDIRELSGTVIFFDNDIFLGKSNFVIAGRSANDVSIDWTTSAGDHVIFAKIENAKFLISKGNYEDIYLAENKTEESKKTVSKKEVKNATNNITNKIAESSNVVSNIGQTIKQNTPAIVTNTVNSASNSLEDIRTNLNSSTQIKKESVQKEIDVLNKTKSENNTETKKIITKNNIATGEKNGTSTNTNFALKPFKYAQLFFLTIFSYIFKYKIIFYGLIIVIVFLLLRYLWRLIF